MISSFEHTLRRIYRERRRLGVVSLLVFAAGYLLYARYGGIRVWGLPAPLFAALLYTFAIGATTLAMALFLPRLRFTIEAMAVARLMFAGVAAMTAPGVLPDARSPALQATLVIALAVILVRLFFGAWAARSFPVHGHVAQATRLSLESCETLLRAFNASGTGYGAHDWTGSLRGLGSPDRVLDRIIEGAADPATIARTEDLADRDGCRILYRDDRGPAPLWKEVIVSDHGTYRRVTLRVAHGPLPLSAVVTAWLDDSYGRLCDNLIARAHRPVQTEVPSGAPAKAAAA
ncbi:hypothetical protein OEW28_14595 [Defluviimonas sp. WL0002]|uniref:Polyketide cyclase / dehydrase and lipid transport n=1 Tax=Albidovulum marisflavi TaxID=2984159 RepID=A0ABT2ZFG8_9RHOB|nr:hypothetical protein [Defluviimonas sp. WL0002]MCV2869862.1 hypothetical protein [Defluviimonas sp. WL0002]